MKAGELLADKVMDIKQDIITILLLEDNKGDILLLKEMLSESTQQKFRVVCAERLNVGIKLLERENIDVILLDLGLPDGDGIDVLRRIREWSQVPVIVISARGRDDDKVAALDGGADDYLTKPFSVDELLARVRVAFRHAMSARAARDEPVLEFRNLRIDLVRREVNVGDRAVHLTPIEYKLLVLLAQHAGRVLTHRQIIREVWGATYVGQTHYVRVHMAELRKKIEEDPARPRLLVTEPGVGYRLRE